MNGLLRVSFSFFNKMRLLSKIKFRCLPKHAFALKQSYPREILDIYVGVVLFKRKNVFTSPLTIYKGPVTPPALAVSGQEDGLVYARYFLKPLLVMLGLRSDCKHCTMGFRGKWVA